MGFNYIHNFQVFQQIVRNNSSTGVVPYELYMMLELKLYVTYFFAIIVGDY